MILNDSRLIFRVVYFSCNSMAISHFVTIFSSVSTYIVFYLMTSKGIFCESKDGMGVNLIDPFCIIHEIV